MVDDAVERRPRDEPTVVARVEQSRGPQWVQRSRQIEDRSDRCGHPKAIHLAHIAVIERRAGVHPTEVCLQRGCSASPDDVNRLETETRQIPKGDRGLTGERRLASDVE